MEVSVQERIAIFAATTANGFVFANDLVEAALNALELFLAERWFLKTGQPG
jgi:hypothetical protein